MTYLTNYNWMKKPYQDSEVNHHQTTPSLFKRTVTNILKIRNSILFTIIFVALGQVCWGQDKVGDYRSKVTSGNWSSVESWETCTVAGTPGTWGGVPTVAPLGTNNVTILSGHTITLNILIGYVNNITINGTLIFSNEYTLSVNGSFYNNGTFDMGSSTVIMNGDVIQTLGGTNVTTFNNLTIANSTKSVTATTSFNVNQNMIINANCIFSPDALVVIGHDIQGYQLSVIGTLTVTASTLNGQYNFQYFSLAGNTEYAGNSLQTVSRQTYNTLTINNSTGCSIPYNPVTCNSLNIKTGTLTITKDGNLQVYNDTYLGSSECLVIKSASATKIGTFFYKTFSGIGSVKVERFMSKDDYWHLYCSPVSNQTIHNFLLNNLEIPELSDHSVAMTNYITTSDKWNSYFIYANGNTDNLPELMGGGKGFTIRTIHNYNDNGTIIEGTGTIDARGTPNAFPVTATLTTNGWNCIGNPFTSALDVAAFLSSNSTLINQSFAFLYVWDPNKLGTGLGGYSTISAGNVPTGQGFFIKSSGTSGSASFTETMMKSNTGLTFKSAESEFPLIRISVSNKNLKSSTEVNFIANTTKGLDPGYDAGMFKTNPDFALYSNLLEDNGVDFQTQCLPNQNYDQYVIPIGIDFKAGGDITFTAETINLPSGCQALLEDRLTKRFTRLDLKDSQYTATVSAETKGTGRFFLHTSDVISSVQAIEKEPFKVNTVGTTVYINGEVSEKANFVVYSMNGKQLVNFKAESQVQNQFDASGFPAGVYILTCDDQNQKKSTKFVIEN